jgi:glutamyl-tRNA synthetase
MTGKPKSVSKPVVTRFAPSPTGTLHIGGARTALFNWLFAKRTGGTFLLRIEDTDRERSKQEHVDAILGSLKWLELDWDGEPLFQFARADRHRAVAQDLLKSGNAYNCYLQPAELEAMRETARAEGRPSVIESPWRDRDPKAAPAGVKPVIRLKTRRDGETVVEDRVQGRTVFPNKDLDDMIILRSDGAPTYNFAVVADDHDMGVTHVVRGVDHLTNTARQIQVYLALAWDLPVFAHVPLIHGADGAKLSKRHGAQGTEEFRAMGYLPVALRNYLSRLGWSHGNDEIFSTEQMIGWFDIDDINKSAARFDFAKLGDLNGHYIRHAGNNELIRRVKDVLPEIDGGPAKLAKLDAGLWPKFEALLPAIKERAKTLLDLIAGADLLFDARPLTLDEKAAKLLDAEAKAALAAMLPMLTSVTDWTVPALDAAIRAHAEATGAKLGKILPPLRAALTGRTVSPPVADVLAVLGRDEALARIKEQV